MLTTLFGIFLILHGMVICCMPGKAGGCSN
jgi:hypothetical protein